MITPLPFGEGTGEGPAGDGGGAIIFLNLVCSVLLCSSVRKRTIARLAGEFYLSQSSLSSLSILAHSFEPTEGLRHTENTERYY